VNFLSPAAAEKCVKTPPRWRWEACFDLSQQSGEILGGGTQPSEAGVHFDLDSKPSGPQRRQTVQFRHQLRRGEGRDQVVLHPPRAAAREGWGKEHDPGFSPGQNIQGLFHGAHPQGGAAPGLEKGRHHRRPVAVGIALEDRYNLSTGAPWAERRLCSRAERSTSTQAEKSSGPFCAGAASCGVAVPRTTGHSLLAEGGDRIRPRRSELGPKPLLKAVEAVKGVFRAQIPRYAPES